MNGLKIFENPQFGKIRTITEDGKTLFCGKDVAAALGYKSPKDAVSAHCKGAVKRRTPTSGGEQDMLFIPEGDLCRLAAKSELPGASKFESWIFDEVIPAILRTGAYSVPGRFQRTPQVSPGGLARLISVHRQAIMDTGGTPVDVAIMITELDRTWGVPVPSPLEKQVDGQVDLFSGAVPLPVEASAIA